MASARWVQMMGSLKANKRRKFLMVRFTVTVNKWAEQGETVERVYKT